VDRAEDSRIFVGPSGWSYRSWAQTTRIGLPATNRLPFLARWFNAIEVNVSYYRQIDTETYQAWREQTPPAFRFAVKGHRYVTHYKRLGDCAGPVMRLRDQARGLGDKLAAVLWQLPAHFSLDLARLDDFLRALGHWSATRHAIEFRHRSWFCDDVSRRLRHAGIAVCLSDAPDFPCWDEVTAGLVYVRLHGHTRKYASSYAPATLKKWADRARRWAHGGHEVHVYFDNDKDGATIRNAISLSRALKISPPGA